MGPATRYLEVYAVLQYTLKRTNKNDDIYLFLYLWCLLNGNDGSTVLKSKNEASVQPRSGTVVPNRAQIFCFKILLKYFNKIWNKLTRILDINPYNPESLNLFSWVGKRKKCFFFGCFERYNFCFLQKGKKLSHFVIKIINKLLIKINNNYYQIKN